jgi:methane monooxygenase component A gamma chain
MSRAEKAVAAGAMPRTEYPPYGDQTLRQKWTDRLAEIQTLRAAVDLLLDWRRENLRDVLDGLDALWIEARIEDRVAVLRFTELTPEAIDTTTLTDEPISGVTERALADAGDTADVVTLEAVVAAFRRRYKPPVMPTVPFMRTETALAELLIQRRSKGWFDEPLDELRRRRDAALVTDS